MATYFLAGQVTYLHADHLNTPRYATDETGTLVWQWSSDAFGNGAPNEDPDGNGTAFTLNLRFPGQYYDAESGLHYNWNRYYDPEIGRYITSDPIGLDGGLNTFGYVGGNPVNWIDPTGLWVAGIPRCLGPICVPGGVFEEDFSPTINKIEVTADAVRGCISCEATCLFPVLASDAAAEGIARQMDKARQTAESAAIAGKLGRTVMTFRSISGVGTAAGVAACTITCSDVCSSCL